ncbi:MAG: sigma factor-like helix-turn-helix DNA-binding protein [Pirellulales bacterium]
MADRHPGSPPSQQCAALKQTKQRDVNREVGGEAGEAAIQRHQPDAITPGTAFVVDEERRRVRLAVQKLDEPGRSVLVARIWQGQSFVDIGAELGYSADATRKIWSRAVRRLSKLLSQVE